MYFPQLPLTGDGSKDISKEVRIVSKGGSFSSRKAARIYRLAIGMDPDIALNKTARRQITTGSLFREMPTKEGGTLVEETFGAFVSKYYAFRRKSKRGGLS